LIYILLPVFKRVLKTEKFVKSIIKINNHHKIKVVFIDDDSDVENIKYFSNKNIDFIDFIQGNGSLWWGGSINFGIHHLFTNYDIQTDDICIFANNDVEIDIENFNILLSNMEKYDLVHPRTFDHNLYEVSSGSKIISWFPFITKHPTGIIVNTTIDLGTARFLCMKSIVLKKLKGINPDLPQYIGDNDFTLRAKELGYFTYIIHNANCYLDDSETGLKNVNITKFRDVLNSLTSIKSANNLKHKLIFLKSHHNIVFSYLILISMVINIFSKYFIKKIKGL
jgi:GT2 family glycosyltransferase